MPGLTTRDRRVLLLALFVGGPFFAIAYGARPAWRAYGDRVAALEQQRDLLARERGLVAGAASLDTPTTVTREALRRDLRTVIRSGARATAFSLLTERVRAAARQHDVLVLQASEAGAEELGDGLSLLRVSVRAESDLAGIARLLRAIESDPLQIRTSRVFIERSPQGALGPDGGSTDGRNVLLLNVTIEALAITGGGTGGGR
jgi:hypothetical protein